MDSIESRLQQEALFGIVHSQFNGELCDRLVTGAEEFLRNRKINDDRIIKLKVPGAFELPLGAQYLAEHFAGHQTASSPNTPVGVIALGVIIRGETPHFEYVASESASGIMQVGLKFGIPVGYGVITANSYKQAENRCCLNILQASKDTKKKEESVRTNNGYQAAGAVWQMLLAKSRLKSDSE